MKNYVMKYDYNALPFMELYWKQTGSGQKWEQYV